MYLIVSRPGSSIQVLPLAEGVTAVGRSVEAGVHLEDHSIAPRQVEIRLSEGRLHVSAVGGTEGFTYRGTSAAEVEPVAGDEVQVGPFSLRFSDSPADQTPDSMFIDYDDGFDDVLGRLFSDDSEDSIFGSAPSEAGVDPDADGAAAAERPRLIVEGSDGSSRTVYARRGALFLGSAQGMDVTVSHPEVARRHLAVVADGGGYVVRDLQGRGACTVNGSPIEGGWRLRDGDKLRLGSTDILFRWEGQPKGQLVSTGPVASLTEVAEEPTPPRRGLKGLLVLFALVVMGATVVLLFSPEAQRRLGSREPAAQPMTSEAKALLEPALAVGRALLAGGRHAAAERLVQEALVRADTDAASGFTLLDGARQVAVAERLRWALWSQLARDDSRQARYDLLLAEGRWHLAEAERANQMAEPLDRVERLAGRAAAAYRAAQKVQPRDEEAKKGLDSTTHLVGRARVREDELSGRLLRESPRLLLETAHKARAQGQLRLASAVIEALKARVMAEEPSIAPEVEALGLELSNQVEVRRAVYVAAGDDARAKERLVEAQTLYLTALCVGPESPRIRERLDSLEPLLVRQAEQAFERAQELEQSEQQQDAQLLYRQVLEYVPDRTHAVYGDARARLEALARLP